MPFIDFAEIKEKVSLAQTIDLLDLKLKRSGNQWRGPCPACQSGGDRALVVTDGRGWYCFSDKKGGDVIALAAHILALSAKDAAQELGKRAGIVQDTSTSTRGTSSPRSERGAGDKLAPLSYLEPAHDAVIALGLSPEWCEANGVGYAPKGVVRGSIAIPFRDSEGTLLGYFGVQDLTYVPADFQPSNVVPLKRA